MAMDKNLETQFKADEETTLGHHTRVLAVADTGVTESSIFGKAPVKKYVVQKQDTYNYTVTIEHLEMEKAELMEKLNEINQLIGEIESHEAEKEK